MTSWIAGALSLALLSASAQAAVVSIFPADSTLKVGDSLSLVVKNQGFLTPTGGADLALSWDAAVVRIDSLEPIGPGFNFVVPDKPSAAEDAAGRIDLISLLAPLVGTLPSGDFDALRIGVTAVGLGKTQVTLSGVWYDELAGAITPVDFAPANITVVPLPAAAWALLGALGVLGARLRRKG